MGEKEALGRLKHLERQFQLWADDEADSPVLLLDALTGAMPYLRTFIAKQEGLEREVARLTPFELLEKTWFERSEELEGARDLQRRRAETAEAKFAALETDYLTAKGEIEQARDEIERLRVSEAKLSALEAGLFTISKKPLSDGSEGQIDIGGVLIDYDDAILRARALLPTVPVEGS